MIIVYNTPKNPILIIKAPTLGSYGMPCHL